MLFKERLEVVKEYEQWLKDVNERNKEEGLSWRPLDCSFTFLSWLDSHNYLIKEDNHGR